MSEAESHNLYPPPRLTDEERLVTLKKLTGKDIIRTSSVEEILASAPSDWKPGEADVDEFLGSIRGRGFLRLGKFGESQARNDTFQS